LEEPPTYAIFILATTEKHKVIPTILSRCQIYDFKKISTNEIQTYLEKIAKSEKIKYDDEAIFLIAKKSDGALRDALSIFDRLVNYTERNITKELAYENLNVLDFEIYFKAYEHIINNDITKILLLLNLVIEKGFDAQHFIDGFSSHLRDLMVSKNSQTHVLLEQNSSISKKYIEQSKIKDLDFILKAIDLSEDCSFRYKTSKNQRLLVEICLMKLCSISQIELKKKIKIIPSNSTKNNKDLIKEENNIVKKETLPNKKNNIEEEEEEIDIPKTKNDKLISGLSISSLKIKKNIEKNKEKEKELINIKDQNKEFSEEDLIKLWIKYYSNLLDKGEKNLASILQIDQPMLKNKHEIHFTLSNNTNKLELEKNKNKLLVYLKEKLNNNLIELIIHVNKEKEKEFVYSTTEKFEKLKSINPSIEKMRKEFKLGL
jgi:DNA polymerase-3 subunit gamma/tau